jgi:hypothetical protein
MFFIRNYRTDFDDTLYHVSTLKVVERIFDRSSVAPTLKEAQMKRQTHLSSSYEKVVTQQYTLLKYETVGRGKHLAICL